jgi:hypothetical protein
LTVQNIRTYTLIAGIANGVATIIGMIIVIGAGVSTFGYGCIFIIFPVIQLAASIIDCLAYSKLGQPPSEMVYSTTKTSAILDLASGFAIVSLIMGIMKLQLLGTEGIREHFYRVQATSAPESPLA